MRTIRSLVQIVLYSLCVVPLCGCAVLAGAAAGAVAGAGTGYAAGHNAAKNEQASARSDSSK